MFSTAKLGVCVHVHTCHPKEMRDEGASRYMLTTKIPATLFASFAFSHP